MRGTSGSAAAATACACSVSLQIFSASTFDFSRREQPRLHLLLGGRFDRMPDRETGNRHHAGGQQRPNPQILAEQTQTLRKAFSDAAKRRCER